MLEQFTQLAEGRVWTKRDLARPNNYWADHSVLLCYNAITAGWSTDGVGEAKIMQSAQAFGSSVLQSDCFFYLVQLCNS